MEKYTNLQELGQGAFGKVYKAQSKEDGSTHALKCLTVDSPEKWGVVLKEIKDLVLQLQVGESPHIVRLTGLFIEDAGLNTPAVNIWLVQEYCNGGALDSFVLSSNPDRATLLQLLCDAAEGVAYLHERNIVHRDVKPDNILVDSSGQRRTVKIADCGIARVCEQAGWDIISYYFSSVTAVVPRLYLSPEIISSVMAGRPDLITYTTKTDVFAMGLVIAAILDRTTIPSSPGKLGTLLEVNGKTMAVAEVMAIQPLFPVTDLLMTSEPSGSPLKKLVLSMLAVDPRQRPTSEQVLGSLRQIIRSGGANIPSRPPYTVVEVPAEDGDSQQSCCDGCCKGCGDCCWGCWACEPGYSWYDCSGKGPGWTILLCLFWLLLIAAVVAACIFGKGDKAAKALECCENKK